MKISELCLAVLAGIPAFIAAAAVPPPPASRGSPAYLIYQDVDYIAYPENKTTVCKDLKQFRQTCWQQGIDKGSARAEQECLCNSDVAYSVVQCFSAQYNNLTSDASRAAYYEDFLTYTYDCYCGVTGYDVTYNTAANPPKPYIAGYTGDAILPPEGGCPTIAPPENACPQQPCNCVPPPKPVIPVTCPSGYDRCNGKCIQKPPVCEVCEYPFYRGFDGKCVCPNGFYKDGNTCRTEIDCPPNSDLVVSHYSAYCVCDPGYVSYHDNFGNLVCTLCCPQGETRQPDGTCTKDCPNGEVKGWDGECLCPWGTFRGGNGECVKSCTPPLTYSDQFGGCGCYYPYYYDSNNNCVLPKCNDPVATCYTGIPTATVIETVTSIAPPFNSTIATTIWAPTNTVTVIVTGTANVTVPASNGDSTIPTSTSSSTVPTSTSSSTVPNSNGGSTTPTSVDTTSTISTSDDGSTIPSSSSTTTSESLPPLRPITGGGGSDNNPSSVSTTPISVPPVTVSSDSPSLQIPTFPTGGGGDGSGNGQGGGGTQTDTPISTPTLPAPGSGGSDSGSGGSGGSGSGSGDGDSSGSGGGDSGSGSDGSGSGSSGGGSGGSDSGSGGSGGGDNGSSGGGGGSSGGSGGGSDGNGGSGGSSGGGDSGSGGSDSGSGSGGSDGGSGGSDSGSGSGGGSGGSDSGSGSGSGSGSSDGGSDSGSGGSGSGSGDSPSATTRLRRRRRWL